MEINELELKWKKDFQEIMKSIKGMINYNSHDDDYIKSCKDFMKWIVEGEEDPYVFLPEGFHYLREDINTTNAFLLNLYHAFVDDGDISFVTLKLHGEIKSVRLIFSDPYVSNFRDIVLREHAQLIKTQTKIYEHSVYFLKKINEKYEKEGKILKDLPKEFKVEDFEIISHNDHKRFKEEVIEFIKVEKEKNIELEKRRKELLGKIYKA